MYSAAQTATALNRGDFVATTITGGLAVCSLGLVLAIVVGKVRSNTLRGIADATGTTLRPDPVAVWLIGISFVGALVSSASFVTFVSLGEADVPFNSPGREWRALALMSALLVLSAGGLIALIKRRGSGYLVLGPLGFENSDIVHTRKGTWDEVLDVTDQAPQKPSRHPICIVMKDDKPIVVQNASGYAPSGAALYWMVRHYWKHPENRGELTDGRALDRLRNEQFDPE
ncbi:MAG: hypothetical protein M3Y83_18655 [Actinomycetota bacterium]|nr:hypothetical protein [Actinomycetota bacterium]